MDPPQRPGLKIAEVAELMQVSRMTVYRLISSGALSAGRVGRLLWVSESAVQAYLRGDGGGKGPAAGPLPVAANPPRHRDG